MKKESLQALMWRRGGRRLFLLLGKLLTSLDGGCHELVALIHVVDELVDLDPAGLSE